MPAFLNRCLTTCLQASSTGAPPMDWLHFHVRFGMERRARPRLTRLHLLPAVRTDCLLLAAISMLQQQLPWHLTNKLRPWQRRLACHLIKCRLRTLFPPRPNLGKHLLGPRAQILSSALPVSLRARFAILNRHSSSTPYHPHEILGCTPARSARSVLSPMHCCPSHGSPRLFAMRNITHP